MRNGAEKSKSARIGLDSKSREFICNGGPQFPPLLQALMQGFLPCDRRNRYGDH
jgi:hypothetical protein